MEIRIHPLLLISATPAIRGAPWMPRRAQSAPETAAEGAFKVETNHDGTGVAKIDITPPPDTKVVGHVQTHGARDPIRAAVLLLDDGRTRAAIVTSTSSPLGGAGQRGPFGGVEGRGHPQAAYPGRQLP